MIELVLMLSLAGALGQQGVAAKGPVTTCVWPNICKAEAVAQFEPCVWPRRCRQDAGERTFLAQPRAEERPLVAQFEPCVWPKRCKAGVQG